ncbi:MAG TPA: hypothetical protein VLQ91_10785 [Draconibacterium sp.]|nr:hypothetical protein [Draconibacterium sp.]
MSDLAHYSFISWLKQGIGSKIAEKEAMGAPAAGMAKVRADLQVGLTLESTSVAEGALIETDVIKTLKMYGPPDVLAISKDAIVRCEPKPRVNNFESNGLPYIEFYKEDFLWVFTPAVADSVSNAGRLTPWLALICLKGDEFELKNTSDGRAYITIPSEKISNVFHDETQHWSWAHVHMNTELVASNLNDQINEVTGELDDNPDSGVCRLLCPRKLIKETQYTAFLIPAFETGRLAGLGVDYSGVLAQKMSWGLSENYASKTRGGDYPVYHFWTFRTGLYGDFESLARILKPIVTSPELGKRDMFIADAGYGLEDSEPDSKVLGLEGALKPPEFESDKWTNGSGDVAYREHLRKLLNLSIDNEKRQTDTVIADSLTVNPFYSASLGDDPIVTPHIYGRWHALVKRLQAGNNFAWINTLNLDPRNRAAAALGTKVVQKNQEDLMKRAWEQVEDINEANEKIKKAAVSKLISQAVYHKHIANANEDKALRLTAPMHKYVLDSDETIEHKITRSFLPNASKSGAFKKITRPGKKSIKKLNALAVDESKQIHKSVVQHFNEGLVMCAEEKKAPISAILFSDVSDAITLSVASYRGNDTAMAQQALFDIILAEPTFTGLETPAKKTELKGKVDAYPDLSAASATLAKNAIDGINSSTQGTGGDSNVLKIDEAPYKAIFGDVVTAKTYMNIIISRDTGGAAGQIQHATLLHDIQAFSDVFTDFGSNFLGEKLIRIPKKDKIDDINSFSGRISSSLVPKNLITKRVAGSITLKVFDYITKSFVVKNLDRLKPVMAYPRFDDPMFRELKTLSQEYILPNIDKVPVNSITLLLTNDKFIQAYLSGLNHEMSRELLWREFPTDQRGTYFRQFWDVSDNIFEEDQEKKYDITKMHTWTKDLGEHSPKLINDPDGSAYLVLLIRGELLKKYPNTQVYAQKAVYKDVAQPDVPRTLADSSVEGNIKVPVFLAELEPDIYLFGFDLDVEEAKGDSSDASKPGWFFVLRERPGQIRFGLDDWTPAYPDEPDFPDSDPDNWNDLSWEHLVNEASDLDAYHIDALHTFAGNVGSENSPLAVWGKNSADMAYILYQNPVLFARHAQEMLPD